MNESFGTRHGYKTPKDIGLTTMDHDLRNCLWNAVLFTLAKINSNQDYQSQRGSSVMRLHIWTKYLKFTYDSMPPDNTYEGGYWGTIRRWYYDKHRNWYNVYEFLESFFAFLPDAAASEYFSTCVTRELLDEKAAYSFCGGKFVPLTNALELGEIQDALALDGPGVQTASAHIKAAVRCFSSKPSPDYANSMKESISAVEAICKVISGMNDATLYPALENAVSKLGIHLEISAALKGIYKYTNDESGVRHARKNDKVLYQEDARFLLVTCSSFVNLVAEKARRQGIMSA